MMAYPGTTRGLVVRVVATVVGATLFGLAGSTIGANGGWANVQRPPPESGSSLSFADVAADVGLDFTHGAFRWGLSTDPVAMMGGGLCWLDYDGDGWMDLYVVDTYAEAEWADWNSAGGLPSSKLFRNVNGTFSDATHETGTGLTLRGLGCVAGDIDSDGDTDLYVTSATTNALLLNEDGVFTDVADRAGVNSYGWQTSATLGDLDGDGLIDLFVAGYVNLIRPIESASQGFPGTYEALPDLMFRNTGTDDEGIPIFEDVASVSGVEPTGPMYGLGSVLTDVDNDGDLDLYVANDTNPNQLYLNESSPGSIKLVEHGELSGVDDRFSGMGVGSADIDRDGRLDLTVTNLGTQTHGVFGNIGAGTFQSIASSSGLTDLEGEYTGWGTVLADFDLDTDLDLMVVNGNVPVMYPASDRQPVQLFTNLLVEEGSFRFSASAATTGLSELGPLIGRSGAAADFDNDGDLDVAISQISGPVVLLRNLSNHGHTLTVEFERFSPGAAVAIVLPDGTRMVRESHAGSSYLSSEDPRIHFGLGDFETVTVLEVTFPGSRRILTYHDVPADGVLTVSARS